MNSNLDHFGPEEADTIMSYVLEHYLKHYESVLIKLDHAKTATKQSAEEAEKKKKSDAGAGHTELSEIKAYDMMWKKVIDLFANAGVSEEELIKIENILVRMPNIIKKYYDVLIKQDEVLQALIAELDSDVYQDAIQKTCLVQAQPDKMSGLDPQEYTINEIHKHATLFQVSYARK